MNLEENTTQTLTRYKEGGLAELFHISFPLMITSLASLLMIFVDRCFLAKYSTNALNASAAAATFAWAFMGAFGMITAMSEVFVAQYNGAKKFQKIGIPVWQMIWLALFSFLFFIPFATWGTPLVFKGTPYDHMSTEYLRWLLYFGPGFPLVTAIGGFYVGRGKTMVMIYLALLCNVINVILDRVLIFGIEGWVPEMGIKGAAIGTSLGHFIQFALLFYLFTRRKNRVSYGTGQWKFSFPDFSKCLKIGLPQGIFYGFEFLGWAFFYIMMTSLGEIHITISSICQSIVVLLSFFFDGLAKGVAAVVGNLIGAGKQHLIPKVLRSGILMQVLFSLLIAPLLLLFTDFSLQFFLPEADRLVLGPTLWYCLFCCFAYLTFEGFRWALSGVLVAAGDTLFLLIAGSLSIWLFLLMPVYFIVVQFRLSVEAAWALAMGFSFLLWMIYWKRYQTGKWKEITLVAEESSSSNTIIG